MQITLSNIYWSVFLNSSIQTKFIWNNVQYCKSILTVFILSVSYNICEKPDFRSIIYRLDEIRGYIISLLFCSWRFVGFVYFEIINWLWDNIVDTRYIYNERNAKYISVVGIIIIIISSYVSILVYDDVLFLERNNCCRLHNEPVNSPNDSQRIKYDCYYYAFFFFF